VAQPCHPPARTMREGLPSGYDRQP
jgi:hypothetical protein